MVEVEATGEFVSPVRRDLFLVGVSVTACSREVSTVRGRIGEGGSSKRDGVGFGSESEWVLAIKNVSPRCEQTEKAKDGCDTGPGTELCVYPGGVSVVREGGGGGTDGEQSWRTVTIPCLATPALVGVYCDLRPSMYAVSPPAPFSSSLNIRLGSWLV